MRHTAVIELLEAPVAWFYAALGFDQCVAVEAPDSTYMAALSGGVLRDVAIKKYANAQGSVIEVITVPSSVPLSPSPWNHIAVSVGNCFETVDALVAGGGTLIGGPLPSPTGPYLVAYLRDPSDNLVELVQRLPESK